MNNYERITENIESFQSFICRGAFKQWLQQESEG